jgi:dienelactone hydrolase
MRQPVLLLPLLLLGCVQPLHLARNDAPTVLAHQEVQAPNPSMRGSFPVHTLYYGSGTDRRRPEYRDSVTFRTKPVDGTKLATATPERKKYWGFGFDSMPVNGRVWYPEGQGPFPLVLIVHGNHSMEDYSDPGYAYLGELFASRGYIFASVDENFLNGGISGENDARGWMLLQHLKAWKTFNDSVGSPFHTRVDMQNIALIGHSRGGEAVAVAAAFNRLTHYPDNALLRFDFNFNIRSIAAIAPVDGQYQPSSKPTPVDNISYLVIHGSHDGDVSSFMGLRQYARIRFTDGKPNFKAAVWMYRANHGQWNTGWGKSDAGPRGERFLDLRGLLPESEQRKMAELYLSAFADATLRGKTEYLPIFRDHRVMGNWLPKTMYATRFQDAGFQALANFDEDVDVTTGSVPGVVLSADSLATWKESVMPLRSRGGQVGKYAVWLGWNNRMAGKDTTKMGPPAAYTVSLTDSIRRAWSVGTATALEFSLAVTDEKPSPRAVPKDSTKAKSDSAKKADSTATKAPVDPKAAAAAKALAKAKADSTKKADAARAKAEKAKKPVKDSLPIDLSIEAVDANGVRVALPLSSYGVARRPLEVTVYRRAGSDKTSFGSLAELVPQSYVVRLTDFRAKDPRFDPTQLRSVRWLFDKTTAGTVILTDIGLSNIAPTYFTGRPE